MDEPSETNTLAASTIFLASIVVDSFSAHDPLDETEAPTAMRTSAVVLVACLASPPIRQWFVFEQRLAIAAVVVVVALVGWHEMGAGTRVADALFVTIALGSCVITFWSAGIENKGAPGAIKGPGTSLDAPPFTRREALANLALASLFYSSFRVMRIGFRQPDAARAHSVSSIAFDGATLTTVGYAYASSVGAAATVFGAAAGVGVAASLFVNKEYRTRGTAASTLVLTTAAFAQFTGAFVATMAMCEPVAHLGAIWSVGACSSKTVCAPAWTARRFAVVNQCAAALWLNAFGTLLMAYAPTIRMRTRQQMVNAERNFDTVVYALISVFVCILTLMGYLSFSGGEALTDYAMVGAMIAVFICAFMDSIAGATLFVVCVGADIVQLWTAYGYQSVLGHFTHCSNLTMLVLLTLFVVVSLVVELGWRLMPQWLVDRLDQTIGVVATAGMSVSVVLFLGTSALWSSYDGQFVEEAQYRAADSPYARTAAAMIVEHWVPLLVWLPLYGCRCEAEQLRWDVRVGVWYGALGVPLLIWTIVVNVNDMAYTHAMGWYDSLAFLVSVLVVAIVPWAATVWA